MKALIVIYRPLIRQPHSQIGGPFPSDNISVVGYSACQQWFSRFGEAQVRGLYKRPEHWFDLSMTTELGSPPLPILHPLPRHQATV
jgi:hypothetical protein